MRERALREATLAVHGPDPPGPAPRGVSSPVFNSVTYDLDAAAYEDIQATGGANTWWYTRLGNPTVAACARRIAALEGTEAAVLFSSGMAAISTTLLALVPPGGRVVAADELYGDTRTLLLEDLAAADRRVELIGIDDREGWRAALASPADAIYVETLSNPMLRVANLPELAALAHAAGALAIVDGTFTTPLAVRPVEHGFDLVLHSATKFLNGHSDVIAGVAAGSAPTLAAVNALAVRLGGCMNPQAAFLLERGIKTLPLRVERQAANAVALADWLAGQAGVEAVVHPFRAEHPDHALARELLGRAPALVSFRVAGGDDRARGVLERLSIVRDAASLGGVESLACIPALTSHLGQSAGELARQGILPGTIRLSVGIEDVQDLQADLENALDQ
jgi:cystathionine beta-lyase/cystathionine gamma-synthase